MLEMFSYYYRANDKKHDITIVNMHQKKKLTIFVPFLWFLKVLDYLGEKFFSKVFQLYPHFPPLSLKN